MMQKVFSNVGRRKGITLLELVVVALIIGILSTIATNVFVGQTHRARVAATKSMVRELAVAAVRYEIDTGELPLSGSGTIQQNLGAVPAIVSRTFNPANISSLQGRSGNGFLYLSLVHSISGSINQRYPATWAGPYLEFNAQNVLTVDDSGNPLPLGEIQMLDSFGYPFEYINYREYDPAIPLTPNSHLGITPIPGFPGQGCERYGGAKPASALPEIPANDPFFTTETWFNPATFQIYSVGTNGDTYDGAAPPADDPGPEYKGTEGDDINNYGY